MPSGPGYLSDGTYIQFEWCDASFWSSSTALTHSSVELLSVQLRQLPSDSPPDGVVWSGKSCDSADPLIATQPSLVANLPDAQLAHLVLVPSAAQTCWLTRHA